MENSSKKQLIVFIIIAYGLTYLMGIPMYLGFKQGVDLSVFPLAQMLYPATGVVLGKLLFEKEKAMPKAAFIVAIITTVIAVILSLVSVISPVEDLEVNGLSIGFYNLVSQYVLIVFCIIAYILFWVAGKEKRENVGMERHNIKASILMVALFVCLYFIRIIFAYVIDILFFGATFNDLLDWFGIFTTSTTWINIAALPVNFFFVFLCFWGEEYGWRYYLTPLLQKKFGLRLGVIILGVVWGLWHLPIDFMYYTTTTGLQMQVNQIVTCIALGIFFAYAYMKTNNIWVPVILHYLNNNLIPIITATYSADVLENQEVSWGQIPIAMVLSLVFVVFIFTKEYNEKKPVEAEAQAE